jgi:hypothetical protein
VERHPWTTTSQDQSHFEPHPLTFLAPPLHAADRTPAATNQLVIVDEAIPILSVG